MLTPKRFVAGTALQTTYDNIYTVPTSVTSATIKEIVVCNTDTSIRSFSLQARPPSGSDTIACTMFSEVSLQPRETKIFGMTDVLPSGYNVFAKASTADVVALTMSGMEYI